LFLRMKVNASCYEKSQKAKNKSQCPAKMLFSEN
jgi:hypothetical protein